MSLPVLLTQYIARRPQRIALLQHIAEEGSITRAAKSAGLSYKAAWDTIDELNNLAQKPLVERSIGGKGGGGAKLSIEGERVLRLYQRLQVIQAQVLEAAEDAGDLDLLGRLMLRTSARNQLHGAPWSASTATAAMIGYAWNCRPAWPCRRKSPTTAHCGWNSKSAPRWSP